MDNERVAGGWGGGGTESPSQFFICPQGCSPLQRDCKFQISTENEKVDNMLGSVL